MRVALLEEDELQMNRMVQLLTKITIGEDRLGCQQFRSGDAFRRSLRRDTYDLVMLDWNTPDLDGLELVNWIRNFQQSDVPIIMLSSRNSEANISEAFRNGADDYIALPFRPIEFVARVSRLLRPRRNRVATSIMTVGDWTFDRTNTTATIRSGEKTLQVVLTEREFLLAVALFQHMGSPLSRSHLLEYSGVSGEEMASRALDSHIYRLRGKLFLGGSHGISLKTVYGKGYRLEWKKPRQAGDAASPEKPGPAPDADDPPRGPA